MWSQEVGPLDPPDEEEGVECPACHGKGRSHEVWAPFKCHRCGGRGRLFGDAAASHLEDLAERAADRKGDR